MLSISQGERSSFSKCIRKPKDMDGASTDNPKLLIVQVSKTTLVCDERYDDDVGVCRKVVSYDCIPLSRSLEVVKK
jgi:hypothetical protein